MKRNKSKQSAPKHFGALFPKPKTEAQGVRLEPKKKQGKVSNRPQKEIGGHV